MASGQFREVCFDLRSIVTRVVKTNPYWTASACLLTALAVFCGLFTLLGSFDNSVFRAGYARAENRPAFLRFYTWYLREYNSGYIPSEVDEFLLRRLSHSHGTPEWSAILTFQIAQSSARWGDAVCKADDDLKKKIIDSLITTLTSIPPSDALRTMEFIESLRRDDTIHKGGFLGSDFYHRVDPRGPSTFRTDQFTLAVSSFQNWWGDGSRWPQNKLTDPLEGTQIKIYSGP